MWMKERMNGAGCPTEAKRTQKAIVQKRKRGEDEITSTPLDKHCRASCPGPQPSLSQWTGSALHADSADRVRMEYGICLKTV